METANTPTPEATLRPQQTTPRQSEQPALQPTYEPTAPIPELTVRPTIIPSFESIVPSELPLEEFDEEETINITQENAADYVFIEYAPGDTKDFVTNSITLLNEARDKMEVYWRSSDENVIEDNGRVHRLQQNQKVIMTAEVPYYSYEQAAELLQNKYGEIVFEEDEEEEKLAVINYYGNLDLVWNFLVEVDDESSPLKPGCYRILVGTKDGKEKFINCESCCASSVKTSGTDMLDRNREFYVKKVKGILKDKYYLDDMDRKLRVREKGLIFKKTISSDKADGWTKEQVSAMYNIKRVYDFYYSLLGRISYNNASSKIRKKYISLYFDNNKKDNLQWRKRKILIGVGTGDVDEEKGYCFKKKSMGAAKDLICHEFTHGVVENETELEKSNKGYTGALNEAYADIAACFLDGNWTIGEDAAETVGGRKRPFRDIETPENFNCPSKFGSGKYFIDVAALEKSSNKESDDSKRSQSEREGGIHTNCTIPAHAVYLMYKYGIKKIHLMKIWYESLLMGYLAGEGFYDFRKNFEEAWNALKDTDEEKKKYAQQFDEVSKQEYLNIINRAFDEVNIREENCDISYVETQVSIDKTMYCEDYFEDEITLYGKICQADQDARLGNNKPLPDAEIEVFDIESGEALDETISDENGRYELDLEYCGSSYLLKIKREGYMEEEMYVHNVNPIRQVEYYCDMVELIPEKYKGWGRADGYVFDAVTGEGVEGLKLKFRRGINNLYSKPEEINSTYSVGDYYSGRIPAGNYCVEVQAEKLGYVNTYFNVKILNDLSIENQNAHISAKIHAGQLRTVLTWGEAPLDIDSHMSYQLSAGAKGHVYYRNKEEYQGEHLVCALDRDDTFSYGPETLTIYDGVTGNYEYTVRNYSKECPMGPEGGVVRVYFGGQAYPSYTFYMPEDAVNMWTVFSYNSATGYLMPSNHI